MYRISVSSAVSFWKSKIAQNKVVFISRTHFLYVCLLSQNFLFISFLLPKERPFSIFPISSFRSVVPCSSPLCCFSTLHPHTGSFSPSRCRLSTHIWGLGARSPRWKTIHDICLWVWPTSLNMILSSSTHNDFVFLYGRIQFHSGYTAYVHYPSIIWRTFRLFPHPSYWLNKHLRRRMLSSLGICQSTVELVIWCIYLNLFEESQHWCP